MPHTAYMARAHIPAVMLTIPSGKAVRATLVALRAAVPSGPSGDGPDGGDGPDARFGALRSSLRGLLDTWTLVDAAPNHLNGGWALTERA